MKKVFITIFTACLIFLTSGNVLAGQEKPKIENKKNQIKEETAEKSCCEEASNKENESTKKEQSKEAAKSCCAEPESEKAATEKTEEPKSCCAAAEELGEGKSENANIVKNEDGSVEHAMTKEQKKEIGIDEKLGQFIPLDLNFVMEDGKEVLLKDIIKKPTIIVPVYYNCPNVCHILQSAVANVLPKVKMKPGEEYQVLSVSFDASDTSAIANQNKVNYMAAMNHKFPEDSWHFLSGSQNNVDIFMDSIGYRYKQVKKDFIHPVCIVMITPNGKISRYIYGSNFLPFDIVMALNEASLGKTGLSVRRLVSICYSYDPKGKKYVFNMTRVAGSIILFFMLMIFLMLAFGGRKNKKKKG